MKQTIAVFTAFLATFAVGNAYAEVMKAGQWEVTSEMSGGDMPAMPAMSKMTEAQRKQMAAMGIAMPQTGPNGGMVMKNKVCVSDDQAKTGVPPETTDRDEKCEQTDIKTSGKTTSWKVTCTGKHKATGSGSVTYENADRYSGQSTITTLDAAGGPKTMNMKFSGSYLGAKCTQPAIPAHTPKQPGK